MSDITQAQPACAYRRPRNGFSLTKAQRRELSNYYFQHYRTIATTNPTLLNQKLSREVFDELLDAVGGLLLQGTKELAAKPGPLRDFLELNTLPPPLARLLPTDFRAFCLALNALKQWVSREQLATDRFLLGGNARDELRAISGSCIVTGNSLEGGCELHHPIRDGRPPIPVCHEAHDQIEQQQPKIDSSMNPNLVLMSKIRKERNNSWKNLQRGCLDLLGEKVNHSTASVGAGSRSFARKVSQATGLNLREILDLMKQNDLVSD
jgi:hypothetical protein